MSFEVTEAFVNQFKAGITIRAAQKESRLRSRVRVETGIVGTSASFDFVGSRKPVQRQDRHGDTVIRGMSHDRRWVDLKVYDDADLVDEPDKVRTLTDPSNVYSQAMAQGFGRWQDEVIADAAKGTTRTGVDGDGTPSTAPTSVLEDGTGNGMTLILMRGVKRLFDSREQPDDRHWAVTSWQIDEMLNIDQIQSFDYNVIKALSTANTGAFMGYDWVRVEDPILKIDASNDRHTIAWITDAVLLGVGAEVRGRITERPDKNYSTQIFYSVDYGGARMDDGGVIVQKCDET